MLESAVIVPLGIPFASLVIVIWNGIVLLMYGADKLTSKLDGPRISEATLLISALLFGSMGATLGMFLFNHKIKKSKFGLVIPVAVAIPFIIFLIFM